MLLFERANLKDHRASRAVSTPAYAASGWTYRSELARAQARIRVLLVGFPALYGEALAAALAVDGQLEVAACPADSVGHAQPARQPQPDVIVLAANYAATNIAEWLTGLSGSGSNACALVLAPDTDVAQFRAWIAAGASAVLTYERSISELTTAVKDLACGKPVLNYPELTARVPGLPATDAADTLTVREREVLQSLADGLTADEAAARLGISSHTIRTHLRHSMEKLHARSRIQAIMIALRRGLIVIPEPGLNGLGNAGSPRPQTTAHSSPRGGDGAPLRFAAVRGDCMYRALVR